MRPRAARHVIPLLLCFFLGASLTFAADLENARARQEGNRAVITYDLIAAGPAPVSVKASDDGGKTWNVKVEHLTGDVGEKVTPGRGKTIVWEALRDYPRGISIPALVFELTTSGGALTDPFTGMELVFVKGGTFEMGNTLGGGFEWEKPVHTVTVSDFYLGKYEVTQAQWEKVMGSNPSRFKGADLPVERVSWDDVQQFVEMLNRQTGRKYRLPTEAEWEYAARSGGKREKWAGTSDESHLGDYAWYSANSSNQTQPVGRKKPNGLGLYDMSGNVWEWVQDWYDSGYYAKSPRDNPSGPSSGSSRVHRGGGWYADAGLVRAADRISLDPGFRNNSLGFRLATVP